MGNIFKKAVKVVKKTTKKVTKKVTKELPFEKIVKAMKR